MNIFRNQHEKRLRAGWRVLFQFIVMFFCTGFAVLVFQYIWQSSSIIIIAIPQFLGALVSIWVAARYMDKRPIVEFGLHIDKKWWYESLAGVIIAAIAMGSIFALEWELGWISITGYGWQTPTQNSFGWSLVNACIAMILVGFYEELIFRGYQIKNIAEGLNYSRLGTLFAVVMAVLVSSVIFGLMHFLNPNASTVSSLAIVLAGVMLAVPYIITGSLALSIGLHFSWNFMQGSILGFPVSGMNAQVSVIKINQKGAELWTGGDFGPEAGLMGILGMAIIGGLTYVYIKAAGYELTIANLFQKGYQPSVKPDEQAL